jgi:hypothetical protein
MNYLKYTYNNVVKPFFAFDGWDEIPFSKFIEYKKLTEKDNHDITQVYELFMPGTTAEDWKKAHNPKLYENINDQLYYLNTEPQGEVVTDIYRSLTKKNYKVHKSIEECTAGEYWDMLDLYNQTLKDKKTDSEVLEAMPKIIAIMCCKERTEEKINEIAEELKQLPTNKIYPLGCFFLRKLADLKSGTGVIYRSKERIAHTIKLVLGIWLTITVAILRLITFRRGSFQSLTLLLKKAWLKCTFRYKSMLELKHVIRGIES